MDAQIGAGGEGRHVSDLEVYYLLACRDASSRGGVRIEE